MTQFLILSGLAIIVAVAFDCFVRYLNAVIARRGGKTCPACGGKTMRYPLDCFAVMYKHECPCGYECLSERRDGIETVQAELMDGIVTMSRLDHIRVGYEVNSEK